MYHSFNIAVKSDEPSFPYFDHAAHCANNLYNAALFRQRQLMTSARKEEENYTDNEREIRNEFESAIRQMKKSRTIPKKGCVSYEFLEEEMRLTQNPDYYAEGFPVQTAQLVIRCVCRNMKSFFNAMRAYKENPSAFTAKPDLPGYKHKGGSSSFTISNQDCVIRRNAKGHYTAKLPLTKEVLSLGKKIPGKLKEVHVTPVNGTYQVSFVFDDGIEEPEVTENAERICAVDFGVENLMAVTNNFGCECLLYKGGAAKSINQYYNKRIAEIVSRETTGTTEKFKPTEEYYDLTNRRNNRIHDLMKKTGKQLIEWCAENRADTIVLGCNRYWKQESHIGHVNNQKFVQIPFSYLKNVIAWLAERAGIRVVEQEESYTSKASFLDRDFIPVYGQEPEVFRFSGKRNPRGLYTSGEGIVTNADLQASANILRKAYPNAFIEGNEPEFRTIRVIRHPEYEQVRLNRTKQKATC